MMTDIMINKLSDNELETLRRDIDSEIERRSKGPMRIVYQVMKWGDIHVFSNFRCAAICFSDTAETVMDDAGTDEGKSLYDLNKGTILYGIKPVQITLADFEAKLAAKYFDDICFENRLDTSFPKKEDKR